MSTAYFHSHEYSSCKSIRESRNWYFSKSWILVTWQPSIDICGEEPINTELLQSTSKWFNIFKKLKNWKNLDSILVNIQALLTGRIMEEETGSTSKFNSIPFYEICLKITIYSINEVDLLHMRVECPNFKLW